MEPSTRSWRRHTVERPSLVLGALATCLLLAVSFVPAAYGAIVPTVGLGTATQFSILAGTTVTNTGPTTVERDLGVSPGSAVVGFPPGTVTPPAVIHAADAVALQAQNDLTTAYDDAALRPTTALTGSELGGLTLQGGVYAATAAPAAPLQLTGTLTLDGAGDPSSVWIFQTGSTLTTASDSVVALINGASACNVFWQVGSSATLGTRTVFVGNIMALTSITLQDAVVVHGRTLARNGAVTLINDTFTGPDCTPVPTTTSTSPTSSTTTASPTTSTSSTSPTGPTTSTSSTTTSTLGTGTTTSTTTVAGGTSTTLGAGGPTSTTPGAGSAVALGGGTGGATTGPGGGTGATDGAQATTSSTLGAGARTTTTNARTIARTGQDIRSLLVAGGVALWLGAVGAEIGRRRARAASS